MNFLFTLTHNSLATIIAWVSTCLLAGGVSTLFSESARSVWLIWGCFGLVAAAGLDVAARIRERRGMDELKLIAAKRFERGMEYETEEKEAHASVRQAVARMLGLATLQNAGSRSTKERYSCDLDVELLLHHGRQGSAGDHDARTQVARITNLSGSGFELTLGAPLLPHQWMTMNVLTVNNDRQTMLGEILWCGPQPDGSIVAGGRFLDAVLVESG